MDIASYFELADTPAERSPVGMVMVKVLTKYPELDFEQARSEANRLLDYAASLRVYRNPPVYSEAEKAERKAKMLAAFGRSKVVQRVA